MKKTLMILGVLAALSMVFVGCDQPTTTEDATGATSSTSTTQAASDTAADDTTASDAGTGAADTTTGSGTQTETNNDSGDDGATVSTPTYVTIFSESKVLGWGNTDGIVIDHDKFEAGFTGIRVTFTATSGCFKTAVCDPWTELAPISAEGDGGISEEDEDGKTIGLAPKENGTITVSFSSTDASKIIGEGKDGAWGGMKIFGDATITISKIELVK